VSREEPSRARKDPGRNRRLPGGTIDGELSVASGEGQIRIGDEEAETREAGSPPPLQRRAARFLLATREKIEWIAPTGKLNEESSEIDFLTFVRRE